MNVQNHPPPLQGLSTHEVKELRARGLGCVQPPTTGRLYARIIRENVVNTVNTILFTIALALVLLGQYLDAFVSVGVISFNIVISLIQEVWAKQTLDRIALLTRPKVLVVGDILVVHPGDQIVVDGPVVGDGRVEVDESLLTGE
jgi:cation-transporting ATPase E